jgi:VWFA-related protein
MTRKSFTSLAGARLGSRWLFVVALAAQPVTAAFAQQPAQNPSTAPAQNPSAAPAQNPSAQLPQSGDASSDQGAYVIKRSVNEVSLIFTVSDRHGHYIPDLKQSDFALLDDQKAPYKVNTFHQQINLPLRVGLVIDASSSIRSRFQFEQQSASEFLLQVLRSKNDRAFVMGFDVTPTVTADWTNDPDKLATGINKLTPGGGTALFDAVYSACHSKLLTERAPEPFRKAIILISDGDDNQSHVYIDEAIKECERAETIVYAISTNWTPSRGPGDKVLTKLSEETGGEVFFPPSINEMATSFKNIEDELRSQYALVYTPADFKTDGSFRSIYLYCKNRSYQVRAKKGYFAPRE